MYDQKSPVTRAQRAKNQQARVARLGRPQRKNFSEQELLAVARETLRYDKDTGIFTWAVTRPGRIVAGKLAGSAHHREGYIDIVLGGNRYRAHRLAWLLIYGSLPDGEIDHANGVTNDNRISNLRLASRSDNECNKGITRANTTGYKGVSFNRATGKYTAYIQREKRQVRLGLFPTAEEAYAAYCEAARVAHGEFARLK